MQIGPRIRVGGTLGHLGQEVKIGAGKVAKAAAPVVSFFNPAIGAALAAGGTALDTSHGAVNPLDIAKGAIMNGGLGALGRGVSMIPGVSSISHLPGIGGVVNAAEGIGNEIGNSGIGSAIKGAAGKLLPGVEGALGGIVQHAESDPLGTLGMVNSAMDAQHARDLQGKAEQLALDNYNSRSALRAQALKGLLNPTVPNLSGVNYGSAGSVYGRKPGGY